MSEKALATVQEQLDKLTVSDPADSGFDVGNGNDFPYPKKIKILQSNQQFKQFTDGEDLTTKEYGKLYLFEKDAAINSGDLVQSISGTVLKVSAGAVIYSVDGDNEEYEAQRPGMILSKDKEAWHAANPGYTYQNRVRIVMVQGSPEEALEALSQGENPFIELVIKGAGFGAWFDIGKLKAEAKRDHEEWSQTKNSPVACAYYFTISSESEKGSNNNEYYIPKIEVAMNSLAVTEQFYELHKAWMDVRLFGGKDWDDDNYDTEESGYKDAKVIDVEEEPKKLDSPSNMDAFDDMADEIPTEEDLLDDDDLPF